MTEPKHNLIEQHVAMLKTEGINLRFEESAIDEIARVSWLMNERVENIGARRLRTILSKLLEKISFNCETLKGSEVVIDKTTVHENLDELTTKVDLRKFIL